MARTLQTSGIATSLTFLICVDDDNSTVKCFKAVDSSGGDLTSSVQGNMTVGGNVTVSTMSWNGHTVPYMSNGTDHNWMSFGTNKPHLKSTSGGIATYFVIGRIPTLGVERSCFGGATSACPEIRLANSSGWYAVLMSHAVNWAVWSTINYPTAGNDETWAFVHDSTGTNTCRFYSGVAGSSLTQENTNASDPWNLDGDLTWAGGVDANNSWGGGRIVMVGAFTGAIGSTDLATFHGDPFGTLFQTTASTTKRLLTLGAG